MAIVVSASLVGCGLSEGSYRELSAGVYLMQDEEGRLNLLHNAFVEQQTGSAGKSIGGAVMVTDVKSICTIPQKAILGSALNARGVVEYFLLDIIPKPSRIESPAIFTSE